MRMICGLFWERIYGVGGRVGRLVGRSVGFWRRFEWVGWLMIFFFFFWGVTVGVFWFK